MLFPIRRLAYAFAISVMASMFATTNANADILGGLFTTSDEDENPEGDTVYGTRVFWGQCITATPQTVGERYSVEGVSATLVTSLVGQAVDGIISFIEQAGGDDTVLRQARASLDRNKNFTCVQFVRGRFNMNALTNVHDPNLTLGMTDTVAGKGRYLKFVTAAKVKENLRTRKIFLMEEPDLFIEAELTLPRALENNTIRARFRPFYVLFRKAAESSKFRLFSPAHRNLFIEYTWEAAGASFNSTPEPQANKNGVSVINIGKLTPRATPYLFVDNLGEPDTLSTGWLVAQIDAAQIPQPRSSEAGGDMVDAYVGPKPKPSELTVRVVETSEGSAFMKAIGQAMRSNSATISSQLATATNQMLFESARLQAQAAAAEAQAAASTKADSAMAAAITALEAFNNLPAESATAIRMSKADVAVRKIDAAITAARQANNEALATTAFPADVVACLQKARTNQDPPVRKCINAT